MHIDKRILNFIVITILSVATFLWTFFIFHQDVMWEVIAFVVFIRIVASVVLFKDYSLSWSKATTRTFLIKALVYFAAFLVYAPLLYGTVRFSLLASEAAFYLLTMNLLMYTYGYLINRNKVHKDKTVVIYGAGKAGMKLEEELRNGEFKVKYFVDDDLSLQKRSIDAIKIISKEKLKYICKKEKKFDLLVVAMPSADKRRVKEIYESLSPYFISIKVLPSLEQILQEKEFSQQLKEISVEDLLARHPKDLDKKQIENFIKDKVVLITGAGGSIGSEISRQCIKFGASELVLLDHSEFNLYQIAEELSQFRVKLVMQSVSNLELLDKTFEKYKPDIVIHAAAYKHVPLVEDNISEAIVNNVVGTKNAIDSAIKHGVKKFVLISTDKAVRPTNVMGTTKRICELYAQNAVSLENAGSFTTEIVSVRFGNVLGSSGSVIPKFKSQIEAGKNITVTHPDITRYFMLIPEACELVLQAASIGKGGEIFILDMGEPIKIVDLAKKMIELSGRDEIQIEFSGLRPGEKLYEELLINGSDMKTEYESITVAGRTPYEINKLNQDIQELLTSPDKLSKLKEIVPEFDHKMNI